MKKTLKILLIILLSIFTIVAGLFVYYIGTTKNIALNEEKLINLEKTINFYDNKGK